MGRNRGSLRNALYARRGRAIGCVVVYFRDYAAGSFVFARDDGDTYTVEMPLHPEEVEAQKLKGYLITTVTSMTRILVPKEYVRIVLEVGESHEAQLDAPLPRD